MDTIPEALEMAIKHHQEGRLRAAEEIYREILRVEPNQVDALHLLGVIAYQARNLDEAVTWCRRAVELRSNHAEAHNHLGVALKDQGRLDEAVASCRRAL